MPLAKCRWVPSHLAATALAFVTLAAGIEGPTFAADHPRFEFTRMIAHWDGYGDDDYLQFVEEAQPEVCQLGFYGAHFWSLVHTKEFAGYPAHFPVRGINECRDWFKTRNAEVHKRGAKVVGHMNVKFLVGDPEGPEGPRGFFHFYKNLWDEKILGPKPVADPIDLLEKDKDGKPISINNYGIGGMKEYWACLNNPNWRKVLKAWTKHGIEQGCDGFVANYFYRHDCHCPHCVAGFKKNLKARYKPEEIKAKFAIDDLDTHTFPEIVSWHDPKESTPLRREMLRWSQVSNKECFDEVFHQYGRSLKPDLITAQWNHLGDFNQINGDERCLMPGDLWGKDETYLWYSTGGAAFYTDLKAGFLGEGTLQARYIRGAFDDKPFTLGKYENTRTRCYIAELAANGGAPIGFYARFKDPEARKEIARYYQFLKKHDDLYRANQPYAETLLIYPRDAVHQGNVVSVETFKQSGKRLLDNHRLFDVVPSDRVTPEVRQRYITVIDRANDTSENEVKRRDEVIADTRWSKIEAPQSVRVSASRPVKGNELTLHFVNYNREEPKEPKSAGGGIKDEKPIAVEGINADVALPQGFTAKRVEFLTPELTDAVAVPFEQANGRLKLTVPKFLVYGVVRVIP
ncbi:MAG: hypothetical protein IT428_23700 [Planctomycetaceae bacterium]|nr:hypothetical protein [Planctomycetaceae bacterium]